MTITTWHVAWYYINNSFHALINFIENWMIRNLLWVYIWIYKKHSIVLIMRYFLKNLNIMESEEKLKNGSLVIYTTDNNMCL